LAWASCNDANGDDIAKRDVHEGRPEWLAPFNFFFFPLLSDLGGYPAGFDRSNFKFIAPPELNRKKWETLAGINLLDGQIYQIKMIPDDRQRNVVPESMRVILRQYLSKPEVKSLAPDGTPCIGATRGLVLRAEIVAGRLVPVGKETDRRWEQGEDPSMLDFSIQVYEKQRKMVVADASERKRWFAIGVRRLMRESKLSQEPVSNAIKGKPVRRQTLSIIRQAVARMILASNGTRLIRQDLMRRWRTTEHENGRPWLQVFYFQHGPGSFHSSGLGPTYLRSFRRARPGG
jgi:hypothetical protein